MRGDFDEDEDPDFQPNDRGVKHAKNCHVHCTYESCQPPCCTCDAAPEVCPHGVRRHEHACVVCQQKPAASARPFQACESR